MSSLSPFKAIPWPLFSSARHTFILNLISYMRLMFGTAAGKRRMTCVIGTNAKCTVIYE